MGTIKFTKLKLSGFKSFVDPTDFIIEPGLTGIVGPNGCGKSNLLEAIRWVMGANSAKAMRAKGMDDVIFNGTQARPARNFAEVSLTLDNTDRIAPSIFNDDDILEVTRRITKGAGSKYMVNGSTVRAKDVQLLFADASTGANSPSLVRQGQINELISAKPENRRRILEEAAGIAGLHTRRHEAELRLRAAETNLSRLDDVVQQIEAQLLSLRRQARQASRYRRLATEIRELEAFLWLLRWVKARATLEQSKADLRAAETQVDETATKTSQATRIISEISETLPPARDEQVIAAAVYGRLNAAREALEREEDTAKSEIRKLESRIQYMKDDIERENSLVEDAGEAITALQSELAELAELEDIDEALKAAESKAQDAEALRAEHAAHLETLTGELASLNARRSSAENNLRSLTARRERMASQFAQLESRLAAAQSQESGADISALTAALGTAQSTLSEHDSKLNAARQSESEARQTERDARDAYQDSKRALAELSTEIRTLRNLIDRGLSDMTWEPAVEKVKVEAGYEKALAIALGDDLDGALEEDAPLAWQGASVPDVDLPGGVESLLSKVNAPPALAARLSQIGVVGADRGDSLSADLKPGQRLVSLEGDLWRWDGFQLKSEAPSSAAIRLEQKNRLFEREGQLQNAEADLEARQATLQDAQDAQTRASGRAKDDQSKLPALQMAVREAERALSKAEADMGRRQAETASLVEQKSRLDEELQDIKVQESEARGALEGLPENTDLDRHVSGARATLEDSRSEAAEAVATWRGLKQEADRRTARRKTAETDLAAWQARKTKAETQIETVSGRLVESQATLTAATSGPDEFAARREKLLSELQDAEQRRAKAGDTLAEIESRLKDAEADGRATESAHMAAREARAGAEARVTSAQDRIDETLARIKEIVGCGPDDLPMKSGEWREREDLAEVDVERKLEKLRREREKMGGVNLRADEEAEEQEERLTAMVDERQDLIAAIAKLRGGIENLNAEGRERLLAAFETVNDHFRNLFRTLFGGGQAELALTEADDPLDAGLEILVSPPGKKMGNMNLMSGGEQALTATALIFAVFLSNPAPICVLDEVDAPLDDANVDRYCNLLEEMRRLTNTRFMVITHNAVTMSRVDRLFGVTMAEKGVSQLVSVDLRAAERLTAAE